MAPLKSFVKKVKNYVLNQVDIDVTNDGVVLEYFIQSILRNVQGYYVVCIIHHK